MDGHVTGLGNDSQNITLVSHSVCRHLQIIATNHTHGIGHVLTDLLEAGLLGFILIETQICQHIRSIALGHIVDACDSVGLSHDGFNSLGQNAVRDHDLITIGLVDHPCNLGANARTGATGGAKRYEHNVGRLNDVLEIGVGKDIGDTALTITLQQGHGVIAILTRSSPITDLIALDLTGQNLIVQILHTGIHHEYRDSFASCCESNLAASVANTNDGDSKTRLRINNGIDVVLVHLCFTSLSIYTP